MPLWESTRDERSSPARKDTGNLNQYVHERSEGHNKAYMAMQRRNHRINDGGRTTVWTTELEYMPDIVIDSEETKHVLMEPGYL